MMISLVWLRVNGFYLFSYGSMASVFEFNVEGINLYKNKVCTDRISLYYQYIQYMVKVYQNPAYGKCYFATLVNSASDKTHYRAFKQVLQAFFGGMSSCF